MEDKYEKIIKTICEINNISNNDMYRIFKNKNTKYLILLLLKKYRCLDIEKLRRDFSIQNERSINYGCKKAEEKFMINRNFREMYFQVKENI